MAKITVAQAKKWDSQAQGGFRLDTRKLAFTGEKELVQSFSQSDGKILEVHVGYYPEYEEKTNDYGCTWKTATGRQIPSLWIDELTETRPESGMYRVIRVLDVQKIGEPCNKKMYSTLCTLSGKIDVNSYLAKVMPQTTENEETITENTAEVEEITENTDRETFLREVEEEVRKSIDMETVEIYGKKLLGSPTWLQGLKWSISDIAFKKDSNFELLTSEYDSIFNKICDDLFNPQTENQAEEHTNNHEKSENTEKEVQTMTNTEKMVTGKATHENKFSCYIAEISLTEKSTGNTLENHAYTVQRTKGGITRSLENSAYNRKYTLEIVGIRETSFDIPLTNSGISPMDIQQMKKNNPTRYAEIVALYEGPKVENITVTEDTQKAEIIHNTEETLNNNIPDPAIVEKMLKDCPVDETARRKVIAKNLQVAVAEKVKPIIAEILKEYEGKNIGKQRSKDISDKIKEKTGYRGHYSALYQNYKYICVHINPLSYDKDIHFTIDGKTITDENGKIKHGEVTANHKADEYIHDIDGYVAEKQAKLDELKECHEKFERLSKEISKEGVFERIYPNNCRWVKL